MQNRWMKHLTMLLLAWCLSACAVGSGGFDQADYFPGGVGIYSFGGGGISKENYKLIEVAQSEYSPYKDRRVWSEDKPAYSPSATMLGLTRYYPLHVRWKLKDGREFILENIDVRAIMREYFKTNKKTIQLQWQREKRSRDRVGDFSDAILVHDIKGDQLILKWIVTINLTPVEQRLQPNGVANKWILKDEEYVVTTIPGTATQGIDFNQRWEYKIPAKKP